MEEIWKGHEIFADYEFSNYGRFKNKHTQQILKQTISSGKKGGYVRTFLMNVKTHQRQQVRIHRVIAELFVYNSDPINKNTVNHIDGIKTNNHYTNLEWVTVGDNNRHAHITELPNIAKKLSVQKVRQIRKEFLNKTSIPELAEKHNLINTTIRSALIYETWWFVDENKKDELLQAYKNYLTELKNKVRVNNTELTEKILNDYVNGLSLNELQNKYNKSTTFISSVIKTSNSQIKLLENEVFIWIDNLYQISNLGRIIKNGLIVKFNKSIYGKSIIKLIAENFVPNNEGLKMCEVIDENKPITYENIKWVKSKSETRFELPEDKKNNLINEYINSNLSIKKIAKKYSIGVDLCTKNLKGIKKLEDPRTKPALCKTCGDTNPENFRYSRKNICKTCMSNYNIAHSKEYRSRENCPSKYIKKEPKPHLCKICNDTNPDNFYGGKKSQCIACSKKPARIHLCKTCGDANPENFGSGKKGKCKKCSYKYVKKRDRI